MRSAPSIETLSLLQEGRTELSLSNLIQAGLDRLPLPGSGRTLERWRVLARVAEINLSLVKLFEGHTDALAILAELNADAPAQGTVWGTWCAEPPFARVTLTRDLDDRYYLDGTKAWCSGAAQLTHAVVSCWNEAGGACLAAVALDQAGVKMTTQGWQAVGMAATGSVDVDFCRAVAQPVGRPGDYARRPGFWHGGAGIAACWLGGALGIASRARESAAGNAPDPHRLAHLGAIDTAIAGASSVLRECAAAIDAEPARDAQALALRARLTVENAAQSVMHHAGRALGAGPLCRDARFARAMADLPVFLRQSHAERDLAALGRAVLEEEGPPSWQL
ncbi:MAG: acyl-CoA dehydrogenase [Variovorax sp.]|nr:MAG: acyl-CoA dehydrogenase [Variovorax sp.]